MRRFCLRSGTCLRVPTNRRAEIASSEAQSVPKVYSKWAEFCQFEGRGHVGEISESKWLSAFSSITRVEQRVPESVDCKLLSWPSGLLAVFPAHPASEKEGMGTGTLKDIHVLCYQHHKEMVPKLRGETGEQPLYACGEAGCLVCYEATAGYFLDTEDRKILEQEIRPRIRCPKDGYFMYLAEVRPEQRSFRLWRCPECYAGHTHQDSEKKAGA